MKKSKEEILQAVNNILGENNTTDEAIALIEDITDSFVYTDTDSFVEAKTEEIEKLQAELEATKNQLKENDESWRKKYIDRFMGKIENEEETEEQEEQEEKEAESIDFDDLFKEE